MTCKSLYRTCIHKTHRATAESTDFYFSEIENSPKYKSTEKPTHKKKKKKKKKRKFAAANLTLILLFTTAPTFANSVDPDQMALKKPSDLELHCLSFSL